MAVRITYLAIALGGACGTLAALFGSANTPPPSPTPTSLPAPRAAASLPARPAGVLTRDMNATRPAIPPEAHALSVLPSAPPSASAVATAPPQASAAPSTSAPRPLASADTTPPPDTKASLLRAEMHCDQKDAAACILAARSYDAGSAGVSDPEKASKYRKIALTLWISQCDHNSAAACATLSDMYRAGSGVPQSDKNADALVTRARELCHYNDAPVCHTLPTP